MSTVTEKRDHPAVGTAENSSHDYETANAELEYYLRGEKPPKVSFNALRKAKFDPCLLRRGFTLRQGYFTRADPHWMIAAMLMRSKYGGGFAIEFGFHPQILWEEARHATYPVETAPFRAFVHGETGISQWPHGLDRESITRVLCAACDWLERHLDDKVSRIQYFLANAGSDNFHLLPAWLYDASAVCFARFRAAQGEHQVAAQFAQLALDRLRPKGHLAVLHEPTPIELEMQMLVDRAVL